MDTSLDIVVTWIVDGSEVDTSPNRISTNGATLSFSPVTTSDSGRYTCQLTATTFETYITVQQGNASDVVTIAVMGK